MASQQCCFEKMGVMADCSRNSVLTVNSLKKLIDILQKAGYNTLQLYTEDTFTVINEPYFGYMRGRYTPRELKEIDAYAAAHGIELIPCVQTLAHLDKLFRWKSYADINDCNDILLVDEDRTYELIENIFRTVSECFTSRRINIGMDEAHFLGRGEYLEKHGYTERTDIILKHLQRVAAIAAKYGFKCFMWGDMFFSRGENSALPIPENVDLVYWDYYSTEQDHYEENLVKCRKITDRVMFAGGYWTWIGLAPHNTYSISATKAAVSACKNHGVKEAFFTMWGDNGGSCSPFSVLPAIVFGAEFARGNTDMESVKAKFEEIVGVPWDVFTALDLPNVICNEDTKNYNNPSKYLLYNDCLMGFLDSTLTGTESEHFAACAKALKKGEKYPEWAHIFTPVRALCDVLVYKADLGARTRAAYKSDRDAVSELVKNTYRPMIKAANKLYEALKSYWNAVFKPHGFDVMDYRLGGMIKRWEHVAEILSGYAQGKTNEIPELEEELLDATGKKEFERKSICFNGFAVNVTVNSL